MAQKKNPTLGGLVGPFPLVANPSPYSFSLEPKTLGWVASLFEPKTLGCVASLLLALKVRDWPKSASWKMFPGDMENN